MADALEPLLRDRGWWSGWRAVEKPATPSHFHLASLPPHTVAHVHLTHSALLSISCTSHMISTSKAQSLLHTLSTQ